MISLPVILALTSLATASPALPKRAGIDFSQWKPGVKWNIVLHYPLDASKPTTPSDAVVWDIDLQSAKDYPEIIPALKVSCLVYPVITSQIPNYVCFLESGQDRSLLLQCWCGAGLGYRQGPVYTGGDGERS